MTTKPNIAACYEEIVKAHRPSGYQLKTKTLRGADSGYVHFKREIVIHEGITTPSELFVYLHECGHIRNGHVTDHPKKQQPKWREEYEADQYAIMAMRDAGRPIPRDVLATHRQVVREHVEASDDVCDDHAVLKYAYGRAWRKHV